MNSRLGGLLLAFFVVLVTLWIGIMFYGLGWEQFCGPNSGMCEMGGCQSCDAAWPRSWAGIGVWVGGALVLLGGFWCAWRAGSGHWGLRRRATALSAL